VVAKVATPLELSVPVPREAEPLRNVTVPLGLVDPLPVTVAVKVIDVPKVADAADEVNTADGAAGATVMVLDTVGAAA
jgi:hypothetical protein